MTRICWSATERMPRRISALDERKALLASCLNTEMNGYASTALAAWIPTRDESSPAPEVRSKPASSLPELFDADVGACMHTPF
jgi:hypothetical protein